MKVISLNLNGIRSAVRKGLIKWIEKQHADLICFQETKAQIEQLTTIMSSFQDWHQRHFSLSHRPSDQAWNLILHT